MSDTTPQQISESLEQRMYKQQMAQMSKDMSKVHTALCIENDVVLGRVPESIFREYFLPYFAGEIPIEDNTVVGQWIAIAGTPAAEVRVIDDVTREELFRVPPIMTTQFLDVQTRPNGMPMKDVLEQAALHRQNIPIQGERYLEAAYFQKAQVMLKNARLPDEYQQRWGTIMQRYNKVTTVVNNIPSYQPADDIDYDAEV